MLSLGLGLNPAKPLCPPPYLLFTTVIFPSGPTYRSDCLTRSAVATIKESKMKGYVDMFLSSAALIKHKTES